MKELIYIILFISFLFTNICCNNNQPAAPPSKKSDFDALINISGLAFETRFNECGEWGGHRESISISHDDKYILSGLYEIFPFKCDSLEKYYSNDSIHPIKSKRATISGDNIKSIKEYVFQLSKDKMDQEFVGNSANIISAVSSDSTLIIRVYTNKQESIDRFRNLANLLFK